MYEIFQLCLAQSNVFLVACYVTLHPALSVCPLVCQTVGPLVHHTLLQVTSIMAPAPRTRLG